MCLAIDGEACKFYDSQTLYSANVNKNGKEIFRQ